MLNDPTSPLFEDKQNECSQLYRKIGKEISFLLNDIPTTTTCGRMINLEPDSRASSPLKLRRRGRLNLRHREISFAIDVLAFSEFPELNRAKTPLRETLSGSSFIFHFADYLLAPDQARAPVPKRPSECVHPLAGRFPSSDSVLMLEGEQLTLFPLLYQKDRMSGFSVLVPEHVVGSQHHSDQLKNEQIIDYSLQIPDLQVPGTDRQFSERACNTEPTSDGGRQFCLKIAI
nr:hypothetical protein Iba_chr15cCG5920 [Ipomoea batatas]